MHNFRQSRLSLSTIVWGLVLLLCAGLAFADQDETIKDRLAILDVISQYSYRWDSKDAQGFANLFTVDAIMESWQLGARQPRSRIEGRQAIFAYARQSHTGRLADRQTRHHQTAVIFLELTATTARTENMVMVTHQTIDDRAAFISTSGIYRNTWRKTEKGWKIASRALHVDRFVPAAKEP